MPSRKPGDPLLRPHMRAAALVVLGKTEKEIAEDTGLSVRTISRLKNEDEVFKQEVQNMVIKSVSADLLVLAPKAVKVLSEQLESEDKWIQHRAAVEILNRTAPVLEIHKNEIKVTFEGMPQLGAPPLDDDGIEAEGDVK